MGVYTCTKPATFAGVKYMPGDIVPAEAIPADRVGAVIRLGLIAEAQRATEGQQPPAEIPGEPPAPAPFVVQVKAEDGTTYDVELTPEAVAELVAVLQMTAEEAVGHIKGITDGAALIVIDACDSRKTVKKAAATRAAELEGRPGTEETGSGQPGTGEPEKDPGTGEPGGQAPEGQPGTGEPGGENPPGGDGEGQPGGEGE